MRKISIFTGKNILMEDVPEDVQRIIAEKVEKEKGDCECIRSQQYAVVKIIREWANFRGDEQKSKEVKK